MVGSLPGSIFVLFGDNLDPLLGRPVENTDGVEPLLVGSSAAKYDNLLVFHIIVHGAVGPLSGNIAFSWDFSPLHGDRVEGPEIIHIGRIGIATKKYDFLVDYAATMSPARRWF